MFSVSVSAITNYMIEATDKDEAEEIALTYAKEDFPDASTYEVTNILEVK